MRKRSAVTARCASVGLAVFLAALAAPIGAGAKPKPSPKPEPEPEAISISTLPFKGASAESRVFEPLAEQLTRALGRPVYFTPVLSYDAMARYLHQRRIDVAFLGAVSYLKARRRGDVRAILQAVRGGKRSYRGVIVANPDAGITSLAELKGKRFAFVDEHSTAGYLFPKLLLERAGVTPESELKVLFAGSHNKVPRMLAMGHADAGACIEGILQTGVAGAGLTVLATTPEIPGDPVVVRAGLGKELVDELRQAFIAMAERPEAAEWLRRAGIDSFVPVVDSDFDPLVEVIGDMKSE